MVKTPEDIAVENAQRSALAAQGEPTEFAEDPALSTQIAGGGTRALFEVINRFKKFEEQNPDLPPLPKTPQEQGSLPTDGTYSATEARKEAAPFLMSPQGVTEFESRGFQAEKNENIEVLRSAEDAIAAQEKELQQNVIDINKQAQDALTADKQGYAPDKAIVNEAEADKALKLLETKEAGIKSIQNEGDFNFEFIDSDDDIKATITALSEVYKDPIKRATRPGFNQKKTVQEVAEKLQDEIGLTRSLLRRKEGEALNAEELVAARELLVRSADKLTQLATKIQSGSGSDLDRLAFRRQMSIHAAIQMQLKGAQTEAGRALASFKIVVGGEDSAVRKAQEARRLLSESGGVELVDNMAEKLLDVAKNEGPTGIHALARGGWRAKTRQMLSEAYLAGLLSNTSTQVRNTLGTGSFMLFQLPAEIIGGIYGEIGRQKNLFLYPTVKLNPDQVYINDAVVRFKGYMDSFREGLRVGARAFKTELPAGASKLDVETYRAVKGETNSVFSRALDEFGKRARIPFRTLLGVDEFFKTISQRGELYVQANHVYKDAIRNGKSVTEAQDEAAMVLLDPQSQADTLIEKAKYDTLQTDLGRLQKPMRMLQNADIAGLPVGRYIMPFATAPTNDALRTTEFVPFVNLVQGSQRQAAVRFGTREHQMMVGRLSVGSITMALVAQQALEGKITGAMPRNEKERDMLPDGWQPWSFVFRGENWPVDKKGKPLPLYNIYGQPNGKLKYVSYNGFGPLTSLIGVTADTVQRMHLARDPKDRQNLATAAVSATGAYARDLPMLDGMSNLMDVFHFQNDELILDPVKLFQSPAGAASVVSFSGFGIPNPASGLQGGVDRTIMGSGYTRPRDDFEYITEADIFEKLPNGKYKYAGLDGQPDYAYIGLPKEDPTNIIGRFMSELDAYQAKNSAFPFRKDKEKNVPVYDQFGRQLGQEDLNIYTRPVRAVISNLSGFKLSEANPPAAYELEVMRVATLTGGMMLTNKKDLLSGELQISDGFQSDWINQAKNITKIRKPGLGEVTFIEALKYMTTAVDNRYGREYDLETDDFERRQMLSDLNTEFFDAALEELLEMEKYQDVAQVYDEILMAREEGYRP